MTNLVVNTIDFAWNKKFLGIEYLHESDEFKLSFSYRLHQAVLLSLLAFVTSQLYIPSIEHFKNFLSGLTLSYLASIFICFNMMLTFLIETTSQRPEEMLKVFKTEMRKVFMTAVIFNLLTLCMTT